MRTENVVRSIKGDELHTLINTQDIVFIDFWAEWCSPCKAFASVYERVAQDTMNILFGKINIEAEPELAEALHIQSIPHLMIFKQGIAIYSEAGSMPESTLRELVQQAYTADVDALRNALNNEKTSDE